MIGGICGRFIGGNAGAGGVAGAATGVNAAGLAGETEKAVPGPAACCPGGIGRLNNGNGRTTGFDCAPATNADASTHQPITTGQTNTDFMRDTFGGTPHRVKQPARAPTRVL